MQRVCIRTVGCRTNQADSLALELACREAGAEVVDDPGVADVVIVNSCAVTGRAARDVRRIVGQSRRLAPGATVIVTGCLVEVEDDGVWRDLGASHVVPAARKLEAVALLGGAAGRGPHLALRTFRPALKVQEGCAVGCTYCVVPSTRGPERSTPPGQVRSGVERLAGLGAREVVLTGTQLGAWGRDLDPPLALGGLVADLVDARPVRRLRLSSVEPWGLDAGLLELIASRPDGLARHLHVPLQSGSRRIHRAMGRPGGPDAWRDLIAAVAGSAPDVAIGTDVLAGFPGETTEDHEATRELLAGSRLAYLHVFSFSPRPGTPAASMEGRPGPAEVRGRVAELRRLSVELRRAYLATLVGSVLGVVVERERRTGPGTVGTSSEFARVCIEDGMPEHVGRLVAARAERVEGERVCASTVEVIE